MPGVTDTGCDGVAGTWVQVGQQAEHRHKAGWPASLQGCRPPVHPPSLHPAAAAHCFPWRCCILVSALNTAVCCHPPAAATGQCACEHARCVSRVSKHQHRTGQRCRNGNRGALLLLLLLQHAWHGSQGMAKDPVLHWVCPGRSGSHAARPMPLAPQPSLGIPPSLPSANPKILKNNSSSAGPLECDCGPADWRCQAPRALLWPKLHQLPVHPRLHAAACATLAQARPASDAVLL